MTGEEFALYCKIIAAAVTGLGALYTVYKYVLYPYVIEKIINNINFLWSVANDAASIHNIIKKELTTNGGSSIKDAIKRMEYQISLINSKTKTILSLDNEAIWESDEFGNYIWVNNSYVKTTGFSIDYLKNYGWISIIDENDRHRVREEWVSSVEEKSTFNSNYSIVCADGSKVEVICNGFPVIPEFYIAGDTIKYIGMLKILRKI